MNIYPNEISDGLSDLILSCNSIAYASDISLDTSPIQSECLNQIKQTQATNKNQIDLFYIKSILASTGFNKNLDVFDTGELYLSRNTAEDKPLNIEHDCTKIIGHITGNYVIDIEGNKIEEKDDAIELPEKIHIVTSGVIYRYYSDKELMKTVSTILEEIKEGSIWKVSLEALFNNFDYAVHSSKGIQIIPRNHETSWLTKHLSAYGGKGEYNGYKLGRLLRNFVFSGKGLTKKPANPESVILDYSDVLEKTDSSLVYNKSNSKEILMSVDLEKLQKDLVEAQAALKVQTEKAQSAETKLKEIDAKAFQSQINDLTQKLETLEASKKTVEDSLKQEVEVKTNLQKQFDDISAKFGEVSNKVQAFEQEKLINVRVDTIVEKLQYSKDSAVSLANLLVKLDDEQFAKYIEAAEKTIVKTEVKETTASEVVDEAETVLDTAKPEEVVQTPADESKDVENTRVAIANLLGKGRKNKKTKENKDN